MSENVELLEQLAENGTFTISDFKHGLFTIERNQSGNFSIYRKTEIATDAEPLNLFKMLQELFATKP